MKKIYIIFFGLVVVVLLLWLWLRDRQPAHGMNQVASEQVPPSASAKSAVAELVVTKDDLAKTPWNGTDEHKRVRIAEVRDIVKGANQPVEFYGIVLDQDGVPLPDVKIRMNLTRTEEPLPGAARDVLDYIDLTTDGDGGFSVSNRKGSLLAVESMVKIGYEASYLGNRAYWYAPPVKNMLFKSDRKSPEIFHMWKLAGAEHLLHKCISARIPYDGRVANFDIITGQEVTTGGDIRVTLIRTPTQIKRGQDRYDWIATIEAVDGGVMTSSDEFMYRAPQEGYESKITISASAQDLKWSSEKAISFYLKSRGLYARVKAEFMTDSERPTTGFNVDTYLNPTGSRNLEYDPLQNVAKPSSAAQLRP